MTAGLIVLYAAASVLWLGLALLSPAGLQRRTLLLVFPMGLVAGPVAGAMTGWIEAQTLDGADSGLLRNFLLFLLIVGPIEELAKLLAAFVVVLRRLDFGHAYGGLLIGVAAGLGFACGENVLYLLALGPERTLPRLVLTNLGNPGSNCKYGMGLDQDGNIWVGHCFGEGVSHYSFQTNQWTTIPNPGGTRVNGVQVDREGNVWGAGSSPCRLVQLDVQTMQYVNNNIPLPGCSLLSRAKPSGDGNRNRLCPIDSPCWRR